MNGYRKGPGTPVNSYIGAGVLMIACVIIGLIFFTLISFLSSSSDPTPCTKDPFIASCGHLSQVVR